MAASRPTILYISHGDIPSRWAHAAQAMRMAAALAACAGPLELLTARAWLQPRLGQSLASWYGVAENFSVRALRVYALRRNVLFPEHDHPRFDRAAARHACRVRPRLVYARAVGAAARCALAGLPVVLESHMRANHPAFPLLRETVAAEGFRGLVTVNDFLRDQLVSAGIPAEKICVWPDAVDLAPFEGLPSPACLRASLGLPSGFLALYAGHLYKAKGADLILEAARALPEVQFVLVGGRDEEVARYRAQAAGLSNVRLTGFVAPCEIPRWLAAADVLLLPNRRDSVQAETTSPLKLFEYMAAGRPIIASDIPALRGVLAHEHNALLFDAASAGTLAEAIRRLRADAALGAQLVEAARRDVRQYTWLRRAADILRFSGEFPELARIDPGHAGREFAVREGS